MTTESESDHDWAICSRCGSSLDRGFGGWLLGVGLSLCKSCADDAGKKWGDPEICGLDWPDHFDEFGDASDRLRRKELRRWLNELR